LLADVFTAHRLPLLLTLTASSTALPAIALTLPSHRLPPHPAPFATVSAVAAAVAAVLFVGSPLLIATAYCYRFFDCQPLLPFTVTW
jgi:hypothetical protein